MGDQRNEKAKVGRLKGDVGRFSGDLRGHKVPSEEALYILYIYILYIYVYYINI